MWYPCTTYHVKIISLLKNHKGESLKLFSVLKIGSDLNPCTKLINWFFFSYLETQQPLFNSYLEVSLARNALMYTIVLILLLKKIQIHSVTVTGFLPLNLLLLNFRLHQLKCLNPFSFTMF